MRTRPSAPEATISRALSTGASKLWLWPTMSCTPALRAAAIMARQSSTVSAIGFSTRTCFLQEAAASVCAA
jgi:hypothetical protein